MPPCPRPRFSNFCLHTLMTKHDLHHPTLAFAPADKIKLKNRFFIFFSQIIPRAALAVFYPTHRAEPSSRGKPRVNVGVPASMLHLQIRTLTPRLIHTIKTKQPAEKGSSPSTLGCPGKLFQKENLVVATLLKGQGCHHEQSQATARKPAQPHGASFGTGSSAPKSGVWLLPHHQDAKHPAGTVCLRGSASLLPSQQLRRAFDPNIVAEN